MLAAAHPPAAADLPASSGTWTETPSFPANLTLTSPDGKTVYVIGEVNRTAIIEAWDAESGSVQWRAEWYVGGARHWRAAGAAALDAHGSLLAVGGSNGTAAAIAVFSTATGERLWADFRDTSPKAAEHARDLEFSPDGSRLYVVNWASRGHSPLLAYAATTGERLWGHCDAIYCGTRLYDIAISPDGTRIYAAGPKELSGYFTSIYVVAVNAVTGKHVWFYWVTGEHHATPDIAVSPDGTRILVAHQSIVALNMHGRLIWRQPVYVPERPADPRGAMMTADDAGELVFGLRYRRFNEDDLTTEVLAFAQSTGELKWIARAQAMDPYHRNGPSMAETLGDTLYVLSSASDLATRQGVTMLAEFDTTRGQPDRIAYFSSGQYYHARGLAVASDATFVLSGGALSRLDETWPPNQLPVVDAVVDPPVVNVGDTAFVRIDRMHDPDGQVTYTEVEQGHEVRRHATDAVVHATKAGRACAGLIAQDDRGGRTRTGGCAEVVTWLHVEAHRSRENYSWWEHPRIHVQTLTASGAPAEGARVTLQLSYRTGLTPAWDSLTDARCNWTYRPSATADSHGWTNFTIPKGLVSRCLGQSGPTNYVDLPSWDGEYRVKATATYKDVNRGEDETTYHVRPTL